MGRMLVYDAGDIVATPCGCIWEILYLWGEALLSNGGRAVSKLLAKRCAADHHLTSESLATLRIDCLTKIDPLARALLERFE